MVWQVVWHDTRISDAPACSDYVFASKASHLAGDIAFEGDVVVVLESERQRWTETVGVDDSLSRVLVTTAVRERPNGPRVARACRSAASATSRSNGNAHAQESEQGVLAAEFCHDSRCKNST